MKSKSYRFISKMVTVLVILSLFTPTFLVIGTAVSLEKSADPVKAVYRCGEVVDVTIVLLVRDTLINGNAISIEDLFFEDQLPVGLTYVENSQSSTPTSTFTYNSITNLLTWNFGFGPFVTGPQAVIHYQVIIDPNIIDGQDLTDVVTAFYTETASQAHSEPTTSNTITVGCPVLDIEKTGPQWIENGDTIIWQIILTNSGSFIAESVTVTDTFPDAVIGPVIASASSGDITSITLDEVVWTGDIDTTVEITITTPILTDATQIINTVSYTSIPPNTEIIKSSTTFSTNILSPLFVGGEISKPALSENRNVIIYSLVSLVAVMVFLLRTRE